MLRSEALMFIGRKAELEQLNEVFESASGSAVVLYGRYGIGKTALSLYFAREHKHFYYCARELSEREQAMELIEELGGTLSGEDIAFEVFKAVKAFIEKSEEDKLIIIFDEFQYMIKYGDAFNIALTSLLGDESLSGRIMLLLLSSSVNWVENSMVADLGAFARKLSGIIKLKELSFVETVDLFPGMSTESVIYTWAIFGGVPGMLTCWDQKKDLHENICSLFLSPTAPLFAEAPRLLKAELRELPAYNAILTTMAQGNYKLNDIYERTAFSRAKISVYIKNLIELDVVEKVFSMETGDHENVKKGMYSIKDGFLRFWYRYVFRNLSLIEQNKGEQVYFEKILTTFDDFMRERFAEICLEYMKLMSELGKLSAKYETWGKWHGKTGDIDIVANDGEGHMLAGFCDFSDNSVDDTNLSEYRKLLKLAGVEKCEMFIFAKSGFSLGLKSEAEKDNIRLINMDEL